MAFSSGACDNVRGEDVEPSFGQCTNDRAMDRKSGEEAEALARDLDPLISSLSDFETSVASSTDFFSPGNRERLSFLQAVVFIEDAINHRSIHHKVDEKSLLRYRMYHSGTVKWVLRVTIFVLHILAFFEKPSSLTLSADPRFRGTRLQIPCGITEAIEFICFAILTLDFGFKSVMAGKKQVGKSKWLLAYLAVLLMSYIDWLVSLSYGCNERIRIRRMLRPFFLLQNSSLMKKTVQSIKQSIPQILSVLFLFGLHLYFFTMLGMLIFTPSKMSQAHRADMLNDANEGNKYFYDLGSSIMSLLVLLTTANNPDVMIPAYKDNRIYAIFFILYLAIGLYFFMNMLLAVIYNQFKGSFTKSMQSSFMRRRVGIRAAFEVLKGSAFYGMPIELPSDTVSKSVVRDLLKDVKFWRRSRYLPMMIEKLGTIQNGSLTAKQFQELFDIAFEDSPKKRPPIQRFNSSLLRRFQHCINHRYYQYFGDFMAFVNVLLITIELSTRYEKAFESGNSLLAVFNFCFIVYYAIEQILMLIFIGPKRYLSHKHIWFEVGITLLLVLVEVVCIALYGGPFREITHAELTARSEKYHYFSLWNLLRLTNMFIIIRLLRIIPSLKPLSLVAGTLSDLVKNMKAFGGVMLSIFYIFAAFGLMIFHERSPMPDTETTIFQNTSTTISNATLECGSYRQLEYYANNFDDFAAALVVLWDIMIVNNWYVFLQAYSETTKSRWSQLYFVLWWLVSSVICVNLLVTLVLEAFLSQFEANQRHRRRGSRRVFAGQEEVTRHFRVHKMFQREMREPTEDEMLSEIKHHSHLQKFLTVSHLMDESPSS